jgi:hypothetical protein
MNITNSGIPVFATTVTRDAAFDGAGEKTLAEGQFAYIEATNTTQYYDGAAWQSVGTTPGLVLVTATSFSAVTSFSLPTDTFSATYANYRIVIDVQASSNDSTFTMRLRAAGSDNTTSVYNTMLSGTTSATGASIFITSINTSSFGAGTIHTTVPLYALTMDVIAPQLAVRTDLVGNIVTSTGGGFQAYAGGVSFKDATQFDSLSFISGTGTITGTYRVYGYANS